MAVSKIDAPLKLLDSGSPEHGTGSYAIYTDGYSVIVRFQVKGISNNTTVCHLPEGYRVGESGHFGCVAGSKAGWIYTMADGRIAVEISNLSSSDDVMGMCRIFL